MFTMASKQVFDNFPTKDLYAKHAAWLVLPSHLHWYDHDEQYKSRNSHVFKEKLK